MWMSERMKEYTDALKPSLTQFSSALWNMEHLCDAGILDGDNTVYKNLSSNCSIVCLIVRSDVTFYHYSMHRSLKKTSVTYAVQSIKLTRVLHPLDVFPTNRLQTGFSTWDGLVILG